MLIHKTNMVKMVKIKPAKQRLLVLLKGVADKGSVISQEIV